MKKFLNANIILAIVLITILGFVNFGYAYSKENFMGKKFFDIEGNKTISEVKTDIEQLSVDNDVNVYNTFQFGHSKKTAISNPSKLLGVNLEGKQYASNCKQCDDSSNMIKHLAVPRYKTINYIYSLDILDSRPVSKVSFQINGSSEHIQSFLKQLLSKYDVSYPLATYIPPNYKTIKSLIYALLLSCFIMYILSLINDAKAITRLKLNGISSTEIFLKRVTKELLLIITAFAVILLIAIIIMGLYQKEVIFSFTIYLLTFGFYYFALAFIVVITHLLIYKIGGYDKLIGKSYFSYKFLKSISLLRIIVLLFTLLTLIFISLMLKPTINLAQSAKYYSKYSEYSVALFNNVEPGKHDEKLNDAAHKIYNATVDKYNGIWIDNQNAVDETNCNADKSNFNACNSMVSNENYLANENIVDENGKDILNDIDSNKKTVLVPVCKKDKFDKADFETTNGTYDTIIYTACDQIYHLFSNDVSDQKSNLYTKDPVVYVVEKDDDGILKSILFNGSYFINADTDTYKQVVNNLGLGKYILRYYPKINDFHDTYTALKNAMLMRLIGLLLVIISIVNILLLEFDIYKEVRGQEIKRKILCGYTMARIFKRRIVINLIIIILSEISAILFSLLLGNLIPFCLITVWTLLYTILEWRLLINYKVWGKNE